MRSPRIRTAHRFSFRVQKPVALAVDSGGRGAWRFSVEAWLAGKPFAGIRLDVAARGEELAITEQLKLPGCLSFADIPARSIQAVERRQHFAEKLHALTRDYGDRPNTRIKDLVDLVLLIEDGLQVAEQGPGGRGAPRLHHPRHAPIPCHHPRPATTMAH